MTEESNFDFDKSINFELSVDNTPIKDYMKSVIEIFDNLKFVKNIIEKKLVYVLQHTKYMVVPSIEYLDECKSMRKECGKMLGDIIVDIKTFWEIFGSIMLPIRNYLPMIQQIYSTIKDSVEIDLLDTFKDHPFKVLKNDDLSKLEESIKVNGVLEPIIVRKKDDRYEIVSGHRRKLASELIGLKTIPAIIRDMSDDEATIYMVDSNMHRESLLPSEKAKAYKMKLDALNHQGVTSGQVGQKYSRDLLADETNESSRQIQRYIRLNYLTPELLDMVDNNNLVYRRRKVLLIHL